MSNDTTAKTDSTTKKSGAGETLEVIKTVVYALLIALVIRTLLFQPYTIPSASEEPNLFQGDYIIVTKWTYGYSKHSMVWSPPLFNGRLFFNPPKRGDVIVFKLPSSGHIDYIKRLIGLPGDRVQMRGGQLYINGKPVAEQQIGTAQTTDAGEVAVVRETNPEGRSYLTQVINKAGPANDTDVYRIPPHCYFMMGDNRDNSEDSRFAANMFPDDPKLRGCGSGTTNFLPTSDGMGVGFVPEEDLVGKAQIVMLSWKEGASILKPWTWLNLRLDRFLRPIR